MTIKMKFLSVFLSLIVVTAFSLVGIFASSSISFSIGGDVSYETSSYNITIIHDFETLNTCTLYARINDERITQINYGETVTLNGSKISLSFISFSTTNSLSQKAVYGQLHEVELYAADRNMDYGYFYIDGALASQLTYSQSVENWGGWDSKFNEEVIFENDDYFVNGMPGSTIVTYYPTANCEILLTNDYLA